MANITRVDYEAIPRQAMSMRTHGKELNNEIFAAYQSIEEMHKSWYGKRYNSLVEEFNKIIPNLNELLELVVDELPFTLETVANNYALADTGSGVARAAKETPKKLSNLSFSGEIGMKFVTTEVEAIQQTVSRNFENAKGKMDEIQAEYAKISWQSEAADAFKARFQKLKTEIVRSFEELKSQFTTLMNQTKDDIQRTESANTIK